MDRIKVLIRLEKYNLYRLLCNPKWYIICLFTYFFVEIVYGGLGDYLIENDSVVQIFELYIFSMFSKGLYLIFFMGYILLYCNAPFADKDTMQRVMRVTKSIWITAQIIYIAILSVLYQLFIQICLVIAVNGRVMFQGQWSSTIWKAVQFSEESIGVRPLVDFFYGILQNGSPVGMFLISFLLGFCMSVFFGMIFMAFNLLRGNYTSYIIIAALWFGDFIYGSTNILPSVSGYIFPFSMYQNAIVKGGAECLVSAGIWCIYIAILVLVSRKAIRHYDFLK